NQLGLLYSRLRRFEEGIAEYREAIRLKEINSATAQTSALATMRTNLANALTVSTSNMTQFGSPDRTTQHEAMDRYEEAITQYQKALELQPRHPAIHRNLAIVLARIAHYREAVQHLRTVLE